MAEHATVENVDKLHPFVEGWLNYEPPTVVQTIPKKTLMVKRLLRYYEDQMDEYREKEEMIRYSLVNKAPVQDHDLIVKIAMSLMPIAEVKDRIRQLERALTLRKRYVKSEDGVTDKQVEIAKEYSIERLVKVRNHTTTCLWHNDKHPSMHVYKDHAYCFVCEKRADAIDFMRELRRCDFVGAVRILNGI